MLRNLLRVRPQEQAVETVRGDPSLQIILWSIWTLAVVAVGYFNWHADIVAQRPINTLGLVIHCVVTGVIGLVVITVIEMRLEPWRFLDE